VSVRRFLFLVVTLVVAATVSASAPAVAQAPPETVGIRIVDAPTTRADDPRARQYIVDHVAPGTTISRRVEVSNDTAEAKAIQLYAAAGSIGEGGFQFGEGRAVNDLTTWTTVDPPTVNPPAGGKILATVRIAVPADASPGERYAVVWAELPAAVPPGGGVAAVNRVGVRIDLSVGGGNEPASDFAITAFEARRDADGNPVVAATVRNTGGRAVDLSGELRLTNGPGGLSAGPFPAKLGTTLGVGQSEPVLVTLDRAVPAGPWDARIVLRSGLTEREATAKITFPADAASSAEPVATQTVGSGSDGGSQLLPILAGGAALLALVLFLLWRRQRRRSATTERAL
jgi:MYXO-CTERM domain-containing protein